MSTPADVNVETLLGGMDMDALMAFADNDFEGIYERLQEPFDDLEQRIVVSSMVQEAVAKGFLKAMEEESCTKLARKDQEITSLRDLLKEKDACIHDLQKVLGIAEDEASIAGNAERTRSKHLWDFLQESQKKWRESETDVAEKEKEIERLASNVATMALILDRESKRAAMLEKQLNDLKEQDAIKSGQISSFQQDIVKLKLDSSSLKRQARLKRLQFDESMEHTRVELQQQRVLSESLLQEKRVFEKTIEERNRAFSNLERDYRALESQMCVLDDELKSLLKVEITLRETIEGQNVLHEGEQEFLTTYIHEQLRASHADVKKDMEFTSSSCSHQASGDQKVLPWTTGEPSTTEMKNYMIEQTWKADLQGLIVEIVMDSWYKEMIEVLHKLTYELAWKDEEIFFRDGQLGSLKHAVEELENDYATLMSICLTLIRDQTDNDSRGESTVSPVHELGRRKLMELSEFLSSRDAFGGQEEKFPLDTGVEEELAAQQPQQDLKLEIVSEVFNQEKGLETFNTSADVERESFLQLNLASAQLQHEIELEIVSEVFSQKYKEALDMVVDAKLCGSVETNDRKGCKSFEELGAHFESFMELQACRRELEACRLEKIGCSTSIAKCEFKLDKLMKNLADQVNEMNAKISFMQDAIKQQEWKHMFEEDILALVLWDALVEMHKNVMSQRVHEEHGLSSECPISPLNRISATTSSRDALALLDTEGQRLYSSHQMEGRQGMQDKDKLILLLKKAIEELRKEKADSEQKLDDITEELYSLKRQFWKEKEIWVSKLSQPQRKEVEAQVDALSRHSSSALDLEEEFKKIEEARFDALVSGLKKEWLTEKENLLALISQKDEKIESLGPEIVRLKEKERESKATEAGLLAHMADLKIQAGNLSSEKLNEEFRFAKCKQDWQNEKESMRREINDLLEGNRVCAATEACMSSRIVELESQVDSLSARVAELNTERMSSQQAMLDHEAENLKLKKEVEEERECLMRLTSEKVDHEAENLKLKKEVEEERECLKRLASEKEDLMDKVVALSEREKHSAVMMEELETERARLTKEVLDRESSTSCFTEEKEVAFALAVKERLEEEQKRKMLEVQVQDLRLEVKSFQGLSDKVAELESKLNEIPRHLESKMELQVDLSIKASHTFERKVMQMMQQNSIRLDGIKQKCQGLRGQFTKFPMTEAQYRQRRARELQNLQKAEAEVDMLGDEVDSLLVILEEVQVTFDLYAPVLVHYPKMNEMAKIVKQEIQLRIDPKYGA
ncbi:hypothetical protein GOP47_0029713 [Adiantum capillus-veneris]|nr:hypothetical protein GOP47_0029422 [Adiantum capillus-veneris]KAI5056192.1 hypothetical protein GOP47_0029713 [Adiantum capillus-veneris]